MTNHDVVKKLVGPISPIAESNTDAQRFENLKQMCHLVEMLLLDIDDVRVRHNRDNAASVKRISDLATNFLHHKVRELVSE